MTTTAVPRRNPHGSSSLRAARPFAARADRARTAVPHRPLSDLPRQLTSAVGAAEDDARAADSVSTGQAVAVDRADLGVTYQLAQAVRRVAVTPRLWRPAIRFDAQAPVAVRVPGPKGVDVWLRTWLPGQHTGLIDLGTCATAFAVVQGSVDDVRADEVLGTWLTHLTTPSVRIIEPGVVHDLRGGLDGHAVTIHAYSPRLRAITEHSWDDGRLSRVRTVPVDAPWQDPRTKTA